MGIGTQWLKGVLDLCVLGVLHGGDTYGYDIAQQLEASGLGEIKGGSLYPALRRLEDDGSVSAEWRPSGQGPDRKYYTVTAVGSERLRNAAGEWRLFVTSATGLMTNVRVSPHD